MSTAGKALKCKEKGNELFKEGKIVDAVKQYSQAVKLEPNEPVYSSNLSAALYEVGDYNSCFEAIVSATKKCSDEHASLLSRLSVRLAKCLCHGVKGGKLDLAKVENGKDVFDKLRSACSTDSLSAWDDWSRCQKEAYRATDGSAEARLRLSRLPIYKKSEQMEMEYYSIGTDDPMSIVDDWGSQPDDRFSMHLSKFNDSELSNLSFFFGGSGDGRHVLGSITGLHLAYEKLNRSQKKATRAHVTLLDIHPSALARNLALFMLLDELLKPSVKPEEAEEIKATLFYTFTAVLMPSYCCDRLVRVARKLIEDLGHHPPSLPPWIHVVQESIPGIVHSLQHFVDIVPRKTVKGMLQHHDVAAFDDGIKDMLSGPGLSSFNEQLAKKEEEHRQTIAMSVQMLPDDMLISNMSGQADFGVCPPASNLQGRREWLKKARSFMTDFLYEKNKDPSGVSLDSSSDISLENSWYKEVAAVFVPPISLQQRHPSLHKAWNMFKTAKPRENRASSTKEVKAEINNTWRPNPTLFAPWTETLEDGYPEMHINMFQLITQMEEFNKRFRLPSGSRAQIKQAPSFATAEQFFDGVINALKTLKGKITCELILGDISHELARMRLKSDISRPPNFPREYTRMWLSNVPDYTNGPLNTALYAIPSLQTVRDAAVSSNCMLNTGLWSSDNLFCYTYTFLLKEELPRFFGSRVHSMKAMFGHITMSRGSLPLPFDQLASRNELTVWLTKVLFLIVNPGKTPNTSYRVIHPNNLVVFIDLLLHLHTVGFPSHWLSEYLSSILLNELTSTVVPYQGELPISPDERHYRVNSRKINLSPWIADFENILGEAYDAIPFALRLPPDTDKIKFPVTPDEIGLYEVGMKGIKASPAMMMGSWAAKDQNISLIFYKSSVVSASNAASRAADILEGKMSTQGGLLYLTVVDTFDTEKRIIRWKMSKERMKAIKREDGRCAHIALIYLMGLSLDLILQLSGSWLTELLYKVSRLCLLTRNLVWLHNFQHGTCVL